MGKFTDCDGNMSIEDEMAAIETQRWSPETTPTLQLCKLVDETTELRTALHDIAIIAENTIPPDGPEAAYGALDEILKIISPFRKYK